MSAWWAYRPSDLLMFSPRTYWRLFELHNAQWWPLHLLAVALALAALGAWWRRGAAWPLWGVTAAAWGFVAWAFLLQRYAGIHWAAGFMAAAFGVQALLLAALAVTGRAGRRPGPAPRLGLAVLLAALLLYPAAGLAWGRPWRQAEVFGLAPDPTVLATLGLLLLAPAPRRLALVAAAVPLLWALYSGMTLWLLQAG